MKLYQKTLFTTGLFTLFLANAFAAPTVNLTVSTSSIQDIPTTITSAGCTDTTTPSSGNFWCRTNYSPSSRTLPQLTWTSTGATSCQFLPATDTFNGTREVFMYQFPTTGIDYTTTEVLPTSGSRFYNIGRSGVIRNAYNNITGYQQFVTIKCVDGIGDEAYSTTTISVNGNAVPYPYSFGMSGVAGEGAGQPGIYGGDRLTPYTSEVLVNATSGIFTLTDYGPNGGGSKSIGWLTDTIDNSLDLTSLEYIIKKIDSFGAEITANTTDFKLFDLNDLFSYISLTYDLTSPTTVSFDPKPTSWVNYIYQYSTSHIAQFFTPGTYKLTYELYDSSMTNQSQATSPGTRITVNAVCPPLHTNIGDICTLAESPTITIIEHGTSTGVSSGGSSNYDVGEGTIITGYTNKKSSTYNGPTLTLTLGSSTVQSVHFNSSEIVDSVQMYWISPTGATSSHGSFIGTSTWDYAFPTPEPTGWWYYKTANPASLTLSSNYSLIPTRTLYPFGCCTYEYNMTIQTSNSGLLLQNRPEIGATSSSQTSGVKNVIFTPTRLGTYKVCAVAYWRYDSLSKNASPSCFSVNVVCPVGFISNGTSCVTAGPPAFTINAYIRSSISGSTTYSSSTSIVATSTDGSFYDWSYLIQGTTPTSCTMQQRNDNGSWFPLVGYASDPTTYTLSWSNISTGDKNAFVSSYTDTHDWKLTCADSIGRTTSLTWTIKKNYTFPTLLSATIDPNCSGLPPTPTLTVTCSNSDYFEVIDTNSGLIVGSMSTSSGSITLPQAGTYKSVCRIGGSNGASSTESYLRTYSPSLCGTTISLFSASPRTINSGGNTALQWEITNPTSTCSIIASPVCSGACSPERTQDADTINTRLQAESTDANDPGNTSGVRTITSALQTNAGGGAGKAIGKKTLRVKYTTDFTLSCGSVSRKAKVNVSNDREG